MNSLLKWAAALFVVAALPNVYGRLNEEQQKARDFFNRTGKVLNLTSKVTGSLPKGPVTELAEPIFDVFVNIANIGVDAIDKVAGEDKQLELFMQRMDCLLKYDDKALKDKKDAVCAKNGCVDTDTCFALAMRDLIRVIEPFMANFIGKQVVDTSGKATDDIEPGLFLNLNTMLEKILVMLTPKTSGPEDAETKKYKNKLGDLTAGLEKIKKLSADAQKVLITSVKVFQPLPTAFDVTALILSDKVLPYMEIPEPKKKTLKANASDDDELTVATDFDRKTIEDDFEPLADFARSY